VLDPPLPLLSAYGLPLGSWRVRHRERAPGGDELGRRAGLLVRLPAPRQVKLDELNLNAERVFAVLDGRGGRRGMARRERGIH
jgi:hypothetical protein